MGTIDNKLIIFDFDGTLVHFPFEFMFSETDRILKQFGHEPVIRFELEEAFSDFDYFRFVKLSTQMAFKDVEDFKTSFWKSFDWENFPKPLVFKETIECLRDLKKEGSTLAVATARVGTDLDIARELERCGISEYFSYIKGRESEAHDWKDKSTQILSILRESKISPNQTIIVGDIPADIVSGHNTGLSQKIAVLTGGIKKEVLEKSKPTNVISDLSELASVLGSLANV